MPIEKITADNLRDMEHQEGLVLHFTSPPPMALPPVA